MGQHRLRPAKRKKSLSTFHFFPRLPLELRIQIWQCATFDRVLEIEGCDYFRRSESVMPFQSPTPPPAVTQVCSESRKYTTYRKHFTSDKKSSGRYIWMNAAHDIIQLCDDLQRCIEDGRPELAHLNISTEITSLRVVMDPRACIYDCSSYNKLPSSLPNLRRLDILVYGNPASWQEFFYNERWFTGTRPYVRIVDYTTGLWMDSTICARFTDWIDYNFRFEFTTDIREGEVETMEERKKKVDEFKGLPRTGLDYW